MNTENIIFLSRLKKGQIRKKLDKNQGCSFLNNNRYKKRI